MCVRQRTHAVIIGDGARAHALHALACRVSVLRGLYITVASTVAQPSNLTACDWLASVRAVVRMPLDYRGMQDASSLRPCMSSWQRLVAALQPVFRG